MKKRMLFFAAVLLLFGMVFVGCGKNVSREAILLFAEKTESADALEMFQLFTKEFTGKKCEKLSDILTSEDFRVFPEVTLTASKSVTDIVDSFGKEWDQGEKKLPADMIKKEKRDRLIADFNQYATTQEMIQKFNTPQQIFRAYAKMKPGDLLVGIVISEDTVHTDEKAFLIVSEVNTVYLPDGKTINPRLSRMNFFTNKARKSEMSFSDALSFSFLVPFRLASFDDSEYETVNEEPEETKEAEEQSGKSGELHVGFSRIDITPEYSVPLAGYGSATERMSEMTEISLYDRLTMTAVAFSDGERKQLLYTMDLLRIPNGWIETVREEISSALGISPGMILFSSTHTHSAPDIGGAIGAGTPYYDFWHETVLRAAKEALDDLSPVSETKIGETEIQGMSWIRHWRADTGYMEGINFEYGDIVGRIYPPDRKLRLIRFVREGKKDTVLLNWATHPTIFSTACTEFGLAHRNQISADYPGYFRRYLEESDDVDAAFFLSASGNVNGLSYVLSEQRKYNTPETPDQYARKLADAAIDLMKNLKTVATGSVQGVTETHVALGYEYSNELSEINQSAFQIGPSIAFAGTSHEMFDQNGRYVRENSPYEMTFVCTCGGGNKYVAAWEVFHYGILGPDQPKPYEIRTDTQCKVAPGTGEDIAETFVTILKSLRSGKVYD